MIFASSFDRRKVNSFVYIKFWRQACLSSLLYGIFTVIPTLVEKFEKCQQWFLENLFNVPRFIPKQLLLKLSELISVESQITLRKMMGSFWAQWRDFMFEKHRWFPLYHL